MSEIARFTDYYNLQGGKPDIYQDEFGLWHIKHLYMEGAPEVVTHISPTERGTVILNDGKIYNVASLWSFEGQPCETESLKSGGSQYSRKRKFK